MSRLPVLTFRDVDRALRALGFAPVRQKGSHVFYRHPTDGPPRSRTTAAGTSPSLLRKIIADAGVDVAGFMASLTN